MTPPESYAAAQAELSELLASLQSPNVSIDALTEKVERARELLDWARERLRDTELEVERLLGEEA